MAVCFGFHLVADFISIIKCYELSINIASCYSRTNWNSGEL